MSVHRLWLGLVSCAQPCQWFMTDSTASEDNCHPWIFDRLMVSWLSNLADKEWMHNGEISGFSKIKRALQASLPEELFLYPSGYTGRSACALVQAQMAKT